MEHHSLIGSYSVLILQHKASFVPSVKKAVTPLGCRVSIAGNGKDLIDLYTSSIHNPFGIFGQSCYNCIILDFLNDESKSDKILKEIKLLFSTLPPLIGLFAKGDEKMVNKYRKYGIVEILYFPDTIHNINAKLKKYIYPVNGALNQPATQAKVKSKIDEFPVINPRTLALLGEMAKRQNFPIQALMESFIEEMGGFISSLLQSFEKKNSTECVQLLVSLHGLCKTLGALQVAYLSTYLEIAIRENNWQFSRQILQELMEKFFVLRDFIETYSTESSTSIREFV
ncbi:MAG TPA: Hpt domain-containing protein [Bacteroidales bacterium]|nr:Hpt domain-containing protein [Bacteroidales bacterium]